MGNACKKADAKPAKVDSSAKKSVGVSLGEIHDEKKDAGQQDSKSAITQKAPEKTDTVSSSKSQDKSDAKQTSADIKQEIHSQPDADLPPPPAADHDDAPVPERKSEAKQENSIRESKPVVDPKNEIVKNLCLELTDNHGISSENGMKFSSLFVEHGVESLAALKQKLSHQVTFVHSCGIRGIYEDIILAKVGFQPRSVIAHSKWQVVKSALHEISGDFHHDDTLHSSLSHVQSKIASKRAELASIVDAVCAYDESVRSTISDEFSADCDAIISQLVSSWQSSVQSRVQDLMTTLTSQIFHHVVVTNQQSFDSSIRQIDNEIRESIADVGHKHEWSNKFIGDYLDDRLLEISSLFRNMRECFNLFEFEVADADERLNAFSKIMEDRLGQTDYGMMDLEFGTFQDGQFQEMDQLRGPMLLDNEFGDKLRQQAKSEIENLVTSKKEDMVSKWYIHNDWQFSPCQNEFDCRLIIISVLREMRYPLKWNARLDDSTKEENWSIDLPLTEWSGSDGHGNMRFETHSNGMISVLRLNSMGLNGPIPDRFRLLTTLYGLDLHSNNFTVLPDWICDFYYLSHLFLRFNKFYTLPDTMDRLPNLWHLDISHNELSEIPAVLSRLPRIGELLIHANPITSTDEWRDAVRRAIPGELTIFSS